MKIALVGGARDSYMLAPYNTDWEIWACSPNTVMSLPSLNVCFEVHKYDINDPRYGVDYSNWLNNFEGLVWMMDEYPQVKGCHVIPYGELIEKYSPYFFTSTVAWMFAMAIEMGADEISLFGIDMATSTEYFDQRLGCQYFATKAVEKGVKVTVPLESDLLRPQPLYGIREYQHSWIKATARRKRLEKDKENGRVSIANGQAKRQHMAGALDNQDWEMKTWFGNIGSDLSFCAPRGVK